jgi:threonine aldolase
MLEELQFPSGMGSDNHAGVHPKILDAILAVNRGSAHAYGLDDVSALAQTELKRLFGANVESHFVFTGTAANVLCLSPMVRSFEAVICSDVAHLHLDECAAPEHFLGGKLYTLPSNDGKIHPDQCRDYLARRGDQHFAQPRVVSLTLPTEHGVCYSLEELVRWKDFCKKNDLRLHIDGARLANAAAFLKVSFKELVSATEPDAISFGGTKNGLLGAEACLLFSESAKKDFRYYRKQAMQLPSKSRFLAAQFYAYLSSDLWLEIARATLAHARKIQTILLEEFPELRIAYPVQSNALFVHLPNHWIKPLRDRMFFYIWDSDNGLCRWMIGHDWTDATTEYLVNSLREVRACSQTK